MVCPSSHSKERSLGIIQTRDHRQSLILHDDYYIQISALGCI